MPEEAAAKKVVLLLDVNGELCVVGREGSPVRGLTTVASGYDMSLGQPGKRVLALLDPAHGVEEIDVWADAGCNDLFGNLRGNGTVAQAEIALCDEPARALYYDFEVLLEMKEAPRAMEVADDTVATDFRPFEIKTLRLSL